MGSVIPLERSAERTAVLVTGHVRGAFVGETARYAGALGDCLDRAERAARANDPPRLVVWSAREGLRGLVERRVPVARVWDLAEAHRVVFGGGPADPGLVHGAAHGLDTARAAGAAGAAAGPSGAFRGDDLFGDFAGPSDAILGTDGMVRGRALDPEWRDDDDTRLLAWADLAGEVAARQEELLLAIGPRAR